MIVQFWVIDMSSLFVASPIAYILIKGKKSSELNEVSE